MYEKRLERSKSSYETKNFYNQMNDTNGVNVNHSLCLT